MIAGEEKEILRAGLLGSGAAAAGFALAERVGEGEQRLFLAWLAKGGNASMDYMERNGELRFDPRLLLEGAQTVISLAFSYNQPVPSPGIARYAAGRDYHKALRTLLRPLCREIEDRYGCATRVCVDSAPVRERYWALRSGIAVRGDNGSVIVPGYGSRVLLAEIITTLGIEPDTPSAGSCLHCGRCIAACPGNAIGKDGSVDANRCLSYLTIEHHGDLTEAQRAVLDTPQGRATLFGCDICQDVCPLNAGTPHTTIADLLARRRIRELTPQRLADMTNEEIDLLTEGSPLRRTGADALREAARRVCRMD